MVGACWLCCVFFFKQKTAYEMRISDWSSDVCSSDLVLGTPGGTRIITMVLLGIFGYDDGLDAQQVAALPRYHHQWMPDVIEAETGAFTPEVVEGLRAMGHTVEVPGEEEGNSRRSSHVWGNLQTVAWDLTTNTLSGGTDPRNPVGAAKVELSSP